MLLPLPVGPVNPSNRTERPCRPRAVQPRPHRLTRCGIVSEATTVHEYDSLAGIVFRLAGNGLFYPALTDLSASGVVEYQLFQNQFPLQPRGRTCPGENEPGGRGEMRTHEECAGPR